MVEPALSPVLLPEHRQTWLSSRKIGSSDAAAACGLKSFGRGRPELILEKAGLLAGPSESEEMESGRDFEPIIATRYERNTGVKLLIPDPMMYESSRHPHMTATPDRLVAGELKVVELKAVFYGDRSSDVTNKWGEEGTDEIPMNYMMQVQHQLAVLDAEVADVACLYFGRLRVYTVHRNDTLIERLIELEEETWDIIQEVKQGRTTRLQQMIAEPWYPERDKLLELIHQPEKGVSIGITDGDVLRTIAYYEDETRWIKEAETRKKQYKAKIIDAMGSASIAILPDGRKVRRGVAHRKAYQVEAGSYQTFTLSGKAKSNGQGSDDE